MTFVTFYNQHIGRIIALALGLITLSAFLYGALLLGAVAHAAGRTAAENAVRETSASVSRLEGTYLSATKAISPERAAALGFVPPASIAIVYATAGSLTLR